MYVYLCGNEGGEEKNSKGWSKGSQSGEKERQRDQLFARDMNEWMNALLKTVERAKSGAGVLMGMVEII